MTTIVRFRQDVYVSKEDSETLEAAGDGEPLYTSGQEKVIAQNFRDNIDRCGIEYDVMLEAPEDEFGAKFKEILVGGGM